jgi:hypothetical protein
MELSKTKATVLSMLLFSTLQSLSQVEVETTLTAFSIKQVPEKQSAGDGDPGTMVLLQMVSTSEGKPLSGAEIETSEISFSDSTGKDLFAEGKKTKAAYKDGDRVYGGAGEFDNSLYAMLPEHIGRDKVKPGTVYLRCHALTIPAEKATGVSIKGKLTVYTDTGKTKTATITKAQLTSGKPFKIDDLTIEFQGFGGGSYNNRNYSSFEFRSLAALKKITVESADESKLPVIFDGKEIKAYDKELTDTDKIEITYSLPEKSVVSIDIEVTPGSIGL